MCASMTNSLSPVVTGAAICTVFLCVTVTGIVPYRAIFRLYPVRVGVSTRQGQGKRRRSRLSDSHSHEKKQAKGKFRHKLGSLSID